MREMCGVIFMVAVAIVFTGSNFAAGEYSRFPVGVYLQFNGIVKCVNGSLRDACTIYVVDEDDISGDDVLHQSQPDNTGKFTSHISTGFDDKPGHNFELYIAFSQCCAYVTFDQWSGYLVNGTEVTYYVDPYKSLATHS